MLNQITIQGRLTKEPELRTTDSGKFVTTFTLACDREFNRDETDFFKCIAWQSTGEFVSKHFHKGQLVLINGRLQNRKWQDRDGNNRTASEIICTSVYFCESKKDHAVPDVVYTEVEDDGELPF